MNRSKEPTATHDDALSICAISIVGGIPTNILHEGVGHGLVALLTGAKSGVLTMVAWSSAFDSSLVAAGGTLVNLAAALVFWLVLCSAKVASMPTRYFLLVTCAFNLFTGTGGNFFFSGVTNFGDWAAVIAGLRPHWLWRVLLVVVGASWYFAAALVVGIRTGASRWSRAKSAAAPAEVDHRAVPLWDRPKGVVGLLNPLGMQLLWQSALPATAGGQSGLLWLRYYIPRGTPSRSGRRNTSVATTSGLVWRLFWRSSTLLFLVAE